MDNRRRNNIDFVTEAGYLPVKDDAFNLLFETKDSIENENYRNLYDTIDIMFGDYEMYALPLYDGASDVQKSYEENVRLVLSSAHTQYKNRVASGEDKESVLNELTKASLSEIKKLSEK